MVTLKQRRPYTRFCQIYRLAVNAAHHAQNGGGALFAHLGEFADPRFVFALHRAQGRYIEYVPERLVIDDFVLVVTQQHQVVGFVTQRPHPP